MSFDLFYVEYAYDVLFQVLQLHVTGMSTSDSVVTNIPPPLVAQYDTPDKNDAIDNHTSRFNNS